VQTRIIENGSWEIKTTGMMDQGAVCFIVRHHKWERLAFNCKVRAEIIRKGHGHEIKLNHGKPLPQFVKQLVENMVDELFNESGISLELMSCPSVVQWRRGNNKRRSGKFSLPRPLRIGR
jgi:hypothetical protein